MANCSGVGAGRAGAGDDGGAAGAVCAASRIAPESARNASAIAESPRDTIDRETEFEEIMS